MTYDQLLPALERIEERMGKKPQQMVVDTGYVSRENMEGMAEEKVDLLGLCPMMPPKPSGRVGGSRPSNFSIKRRRMGMFVLPAKF